jgi:hypothetical protein
VCIAKVPARFGGRRRNILRGGVPRLPYRDALRLGSREPGAASAARAQTKARKTKFRDWASELAKEVAKEQMPALATRDLSLVESRAAIDSLLIR